MITRVIERQIEEWLGIHSCERLNTFVKEHPGWEDCNVPEEFMCPEPKLWCVGVCPLYPERNEKS